MHVASRLPPVVAGHPSAAPCVVLTIRLCACRVAVCDRHQVRWADRGIRREDGKRGEQMVDDTIHAAINNKVLEHVLEAKGAGDGEAVDAPTIVLATGDGNNNHDNSTTFPRVCIQALKAGFNVELWSWKGTEQRLLLRVSLPAAF